MAIVLVQSKVTNNFSTASNMALSFDATPTVGNTVIAMAQGYFVGATWGTGACTDNQSNTYTKAFAEDYQTGAARWSALYYCLAVPTASGTFTVTLADGGSYSVYGTMVILEFSGIDAFEGYATRDQTVSAATMTVARTVGTASGLVLAQYGPTGTMSSIGVQTLTQLSEQLSDSTAAAETDYLIASIPTPESRGRPLVPIPGMTPSLLNLPQGCAFRGRCPRASEACLTEPQPVEVRPAQWVRCWHAGAPEVQ